MSSTSRPSSAPTACAVEHGSIQVVSADCPDQTCVNMGAISGGYVPHRLRPAQAGHRYTYGGLRMRSTRRLALIAALSAVALTIFVAESQIPPVVPVPGRKARPRQHSHAGRHGDIGPARRLRRARRAPCAGQRLHRRLLRLHVLAGRRPARLRRDVRAHRRLPEKLLWVVSVFAALAHTSASCWWPFSSQARPAS